MSDYQQVEKELARGTPAELLCATCPWDRLCISPPTMSRQEIDRQIEDARRSDEAKDPDGKGMPVGMLLTVITMGGRDRMGQLCPVFALRLGSPSGRTVADSLKATMRGWDDQDGEAE